MGYSYSQFYPYRPLIKPPFLQGFSDIGAAVLNNLRWHDMVGLPHQGLGLYLSEGAGEKTYDLSGNGVNPNFYNSPTWNGRQILFDNGSNQYLEVDKTAIPGWPFTVICRFRLDETGSSQIAVFIGDKDEDDIHERGT